LLWTTPQTLAERIWQPIDDGDAVPFPLADIQQAIFAALGVFLKSANDVLASASGGADRSSNS
jgi:hypothetical protein